MGNLFLFGALIIIWVQGFSGIEFGINFPAGYSVQFLLCWHVLYSSTYCFTFFVTPGHQKFLVTNFTVFHYPLCPSTGISCCNQMISILNFLFFSIYNLSFLIYNTINFSLFLISQYLYPCSFHFFHCLDHFIIFYFQLFYFLQ